MSVSVNDKNIGHVTAYAYAKAKGYTGTEEEFAQLMADYGSVAQAAAQSASEAAQSAQDAAGSSTEAQTAKTAAETARTDAQAARDGAQTAQAGAQAARTGAETAQSRAETARTGAETARTQAAGSAEAASTSATNASASETAAAASATVAQTAQTGAETAKTAAETAQGMAESAAGSIAESAEQISTNTQDISSLKDGLTAVESDVTDLKEDIQVTPIRYTIGRYDPTNKRKVGTQSDRIFTSLIKCYEADTIIPYVGYKFVYYLYDNSGTLISSHDGTWRTSDISIANQGGFFAIVFASTTFGTLTQSDVDTISASFKIRTRIDAIEEEAINSGVFTQYNSAYNGIIKGIKLYDPALNDVGISSHNINVSRVKCVSNGDGSYNMQITLYTVSSGAFQTYVGNAINPRYIDPVGIKTERIIKTGNYGVKTLGVITIDWDAFNNKFGYTTQNISDTSAKFEINETNYIDTNAVIPPTSVFLTQQNYSEPILTVVDDDGKRDFSTFAEMLTSKGVSASSALITNMVGGAAFMDIETIMSLKASGFDFISHTADHDVNIYGSSVGTGNYTNFSNVNDDAIRTSMKTARMYLLKYGLNADALAFPWGNYPTGYNATTNNPDSSGSDQYVCGAENQVERYTRIAREVGYRYALNSTGGLMTALNYNDMWIPREPFYADNERYPISYYTNLIDECYAKGGWLILMTHCADPTYGDVNKLESVIDYAVAKGVAIRNLKTAYSIKKHSVSVGNYFDISHRMVIDAAGNFIAQMT